MLLFLLLLLCCADVLLFFCMHAFFRCFFKNLYLILIHDDFFLLSRSYLNFVRRQCCRTDKMQSEKISFVITVPHIFFC